MPWSEESVEQAIQTAKANNAIFVVYVEDDTKVTTLHNILESSLVKTMIGSDKFVAVRLRSSSRMYRNFVDIYQLVPVPSIFFIGNNGWPLEIISGELSEHDVIQRIKGLLDESGDNASEEHTGPDDKNNQSSSAVKNEREDSTSLELPNVSQKADNKVASSAYSNHDSLESKKLEIGQSNMPQTPDLSMVHEATPSSTEVDNNLLSTQAAIATNITTRPSLQETPSTFEDPSECVEKSSVPSTSPPNIGSDEAKVIDRPQTNFKTSRTTQLDNEQSRYSVPTASRELQPQTKPPIVEITHEHHQSRIQFRLPDGSSHTHCFQATTTIAEVREYVIRNLNLPYRDFTMSTGYPRFELTQLEETLGSLNMVPTAVVLINPLATLTPANNYISMARNVLWQVLVQPFSAVNVIFTYMYERLFGGARDNSGDSTSRTPEDNDPAVAEQENQAHEVRNPSNVPSAVLRQRCTIQRDGNVYRLSNRPDDSDDENNTWNGNSTQQM